MKNKEHIKKQVEATFKALDALEEVKVNYFFKQNVVQQLNNKKEEKTSILGWFTPRFQLATLGLLLLLNASAVLYAFSYPAQTIDAHLAAFAQEYSLQSETTSILN
jgi:hypothetical protein